MQRAVTSNRWAAGALVLMIGAGAAACNRTARAPEQTTDATAGQPAIPRSDSWITTSVQAKYYADDRLRGGNVDVSSDGGVVTLRGTVQDEGARQQAVALAQGVDGVTRVEDHLDVRGEQASAAPSGSATTSPPPPEGSQQPTGTAGSGSDTVAPAWITTKINAQYFANPDVKPWNVEVTTSGGGVVTLRGEVENQRARTEAVRLARETDGVARVDDQLRVKGEVRTADAPGAGAPPDEGADEPDSWVTARIQSKYFLDDDVKARDIDVTTSSGVVSLNGIVASEAERRQALALARNTDGVRDVTDNLQIRSDGTAPGAASGSIEKVRSLDAAANDTWITTRIQSKYFLDRTVKGHEIDVDTRNGVVTLKGQVSADGLKQEAERIARETSGVTRVVNQITVTGT